jgi:hypothetical protein
MLATKSVFVAVARSSFAELQAAIRAGRDLVSTGKLNHLFNDPAKS